MQPGGRELAARTRCPAPAPIPPFTLRSRALPQGIPPEPADGGAPQYSPRPPPGLRVGPETQRLAKLCLTAI